MVVFFRVENRSYLNHSWGRILYFYVSLSIIKQLNFDVSWVYKSRNLILTDFVSIKHANIQRTSGLVIEIDACRYRNYLINLVFVSTHLHCKLHILAHCNETRLLSIRMNSLYDDRKSCRVDSTENNYYWFFRKFRVNLNKTIFNFTCACCQLLYCWLSSERENINTATNLIDMYLHFFNWGILTDIFVYF